MINENLHGKCFLLILGGLKHTDLNGVHYQADPLRIGTASDFGSKLTIMRVDPRDAVLYQTERLMHLIATE